MCEESGGSVLLKQVEKKSLNISAFSPSVLATELPCVRAGIELHFLFRYFTAFQNFFGLLGSILLKNLDLAKHNCETTLFRVFLYFSKSDFLLVLLARMKSMFLFLINCIRHLLNQGRLRLVDSDLWGIHSFLMSKKCCLQLSHDKLISLVIQSVSSISL